MQFFTVILLALSATTLALPAQLGHHAVFQGRTASSSPSKSSGAKTPKPSSPSNSTGAVSPGSNSGSNSTINAALVPDFGVIAGTNANAQQTGSCDGFAAATNKNVLIPCSCPPSRASFLAALNKNVAAGEVEGTKVEFSNKEGAAGNKLRGTAMLVTLQNLNGPGKGCPAASAPNFAVLQTKGEFSESVFVGDGAKNNAED